MPWQTLVASALHPFYIRNPNRGTPFMSVLLWFMVLSPVPLLLLAWLSLGSEGESDGRGEN